MREPTAVHRRVAVIVAIAAGPLYGPLVEPVPAATSCVARVLAAAANGATLRLRCETFGMREDAPTAPECLAKAAHPAIDGDGVWSAPP